VLVVGGVRSLAGWDGGGGGICAHLDMTTMSIMKFIPLYCECSNSNKCVQKCLDI
jgi:hypothetical protein